MLLMDGHVDMEGRGFSKLICGIFKRSISSPLKSFSRFKALTLTLKLVIDMQYTVYIKLPLCTINVTASSC